MPTVANDASVLADNRLLSAALEYADYGWKVMPLHCPRGSGCSCNREECETIGKHPRIKAWQINSSKDEDQISQWWTRWADANVGVQLGQESNLIDLECDDEQAEKDLLTLFANEPLVCPTFFGKRGKHRLFLWRAGLPEKAVFHLGAVEVRTGNGKKGAQSVFPPSMHASGHRYNWQVSPSEVPPPPLPDSVFAMMVNMADESSLRPDKEPSVRHKLYSQATIQQKVDGRDNVIHAEACALWNEQVRMYGHKCLDSPESQTTVYGRLWAWNKAKCVPCLADAIVLEKCESARKFILQKSLDNKKGQSLTALGLELRDGEWWPGSWRVQSINSDPPIARLFAPFLPNKSIDLMMEQFDSATKVHQAVLGATGTVCLDDGVLPWRAIWKGFKRKAESGKAEYVRGLEAKLLDTAEVIEAPPEVRRTHVVAEFLWNQLEKARPIDEERGFPKAPRAFSRADGTTWFAFKAICKEAEFDGDKITRNELSKLVHQIGVRDGEPWDRSSRKRYMILDEKARGRLQDLAVFRTNAPV